MLKIDPQLHWHVCYASLTKNSFPIELTKKDGMITFTILQGEGTHVQITIPAFVPKQMELTGTYTILERNYKAPITFFVKNEGKTLEGHLSGDLARFQFSISANSN